MRNKIAIILILILGLTLSAWGQIDWDARIPKYDPDVKVGKLKNGLTYYIKKNSHPAKKVELSFVVNVGSILEREDQRGLAHFLEHMAFNGSKNFKKNDLIKYLQSIGMRFGADLNAATSFDETTYWISIPTTKKEYLDKGLLALSDWAGRLTLDPEEIEKERGVVIEELRTRKGALPRAMSESHKILYAGSQYGKRLPAGTLQNLKTFKHQSLIDFYEDWYRPDLMAVVAVGDLNVDEVESKIKNLFLPFKPKRAIKKRKEFKVPINEKAIWALQTDSEMTDIWIDFFKTVGPAFKNETFGELKKEISTAFAAKIFRKRLQEAHDQATNPAFIPLRSRYVRLFRYQRGARLSAKLFKGRIDEGILELLSVFKRFKEYGITKGELEAEKKTYLSQTKRIFANRGKSSSKGFARRYAFQFLTGTHISGAEWRNNNAADVLSNITVEDVNNEIIDLLDEKGLRISLVGPKQEGFKYPTLANVSKVMKQASLAKVKPYVNKISNEPLVKDLDAKASIVKKFEDKKFGIKRWQLSNGINVWLKKTDFAKKAFRIQGFSPGGLSLFSNEDVKKAKEAAALFRHTGVKDMNLTTLKNKLRGQLSHAGVALQPEFETIWGTSRGDNPETTFQLLYLYFTDPHFSEADLERAKKNAESYKNALSNPDAYFRNVISETENRNNPRFVGQFDATYLNQLTLEDIKKYYKKSYSDASDYNFVIVGDFDVNTLRSLVVKYLGNLPVTNERASWKDRSYKRFTGPYKKNIYAYSDDDVAKVVLKVQGSYKKEDFNALKQLQQIVQIRLTEKLRENLGGVYNPAVRLHTDNLPEPRYVFQVFFPCDPKNVDTLVAATLEEIRKLRRGEINQSDIDKVHKSSVITINEATKSNRAWMNSIVRMLKEGDGLKTAEEQISVVKSNQRKQLKRAAKKYLNFHKKRIEYIGMPKAFDPNNKTANSVKPK